MHTRCRSNAAKRESLRVFYRVDGLGKIDQNEPTMVHQDVVGRQVAVCVARFNHMSECHPQLVVQQTSLIDGGMKLCESRCGYTIVVTNRERVGRPIGTADAQIAATCRSHGAVARYPQCR